MWPLLVAFSSSSFSIHNVKCGNLICSPPFPGLSQAACHLLAYGLNSSESGANPGPISWRQRGSDGERQTQVCHQWGCGQGSLVWWESKDRSKAWPLPYHRDPQTFDLTQINQRSNNSGELMQVHSALYPGKIKACALNISKLYILIVPVVLF